MRRGELPEEFNHTAFNFLIRGPRKGGETVPENLPWMPLNFWESLMALGDLEEFGKLPADMQEAPQRFQEWYNHVTATPANHSLAAVIDDVIITWVEDGLSAANRETAIKADYTIKKH